VTDDIFHYFIMDTCKLHIIINHFLNINLTR